MLHLVDIDCYICTSIYCCWVLLHETFEKHTPEGVLCVCLLCSGLCLNPNTHKQGVDFVCFALFHKQPLTRGNHKRGLCLLGPCSTINKSERVVCVICSAPQPTNQQSNTRVWRCWEQNTPSGTPVLHQTPQPPPNPPPPCARASSSDGLKHGILQQRCTSENSGSSSSSSSQPRFCFSCSLTLA